MNKKEVIALLFCSTALALAYAGAGHTAAQNSTFDDVEILVVDDFTNQGMYELVRVFYDPDAIDMAFFEAGYPGGSVQNVADVENIIRRFQGWINEETIVDFVNGDVYNDNCVVNLEEQGHARIGMIGGGIDNHGELVATLLDRLKTDKAIDIHIEPVPTEGLTTSVVASRIADVVYNSEYAYHVINMSFVIVPCSLVDDLVRYQLLLEFAEDKDDIAMFQATLDALTQFAYTAPGVGDDPLAKLLTDYANNVSAVSSAGNFGFDFPYAPGAWDSVISVSGSADDFGFVSQYDLYEDQYGKSNSGEVKMPGVWELDGIWASGTSFAAPRLSFVMAVYLSQASGDTCRGQGAHPVLADIGWNNRNLVEAANDVTCDDLLYWADAFGLLYP